MLFIRTARRGLDLHRCNRHMKVTASQLHQSTPDFAVARLIAGVGRRTYLDVEVTDYGSCAFGAGLICRRPIGGRPVYSTRKAHKCRQGENR